MRCNLLRPWLLTLFSFGVDGEIVGLLYGSTPEASKFEKLRHSVNFLSSRLLEHLLDIAFTFGTGVAVYFAALFAVG